MLPIPGVTKKTKIANTIAASNADTKVKAQAQYVCDGVADQVQINAAIAAVAALGGGSVSLSEGTFVVSSAILPLSNVSIAGQGWSTIVTLPNGATNAVFDFDTPAGIISNIVVRNLKVDGNGDNVTSGFIFDIAGTSNLLIEHVWTTNSYGENFHITGVDASKITLRDCKVTNFGKGGGIGDFYYSAYEIDDGANDILLDACYADTPGVADFAIPYDCHNHDGATPVNNIVIRDCVGKRTDLGGILVIYKAQAGAPQPTGKITVIGGFYEGAGETTDVQIRSAKNVIFDHVRIKNAALDIRAGAYAPSDITIIAPEVTDLVTGTRPAIKIWDALDVTVISPQVENCAAGAIVLESCQRVEIDGGKLKNTCQGANNTYSVIKLTDDGVNFSTNNIIRAPRIIETAANKAKYGIEENAAGDNYNKIITPSITGVVTADILKKGLMSEVIGGPYERDYRIVVPFNSPYLTTTVVGGGGAYEFPNHIRAFTSVTANSSVRKHGTLRLLFDSSWSRRWEFRCSLQRLSSDAEAIAYLQYKSVQTIGDLAAAGLGLKISNLTLVGESYGAARNTQALLDMGNNTIYQVKIILDPSIPRITWEVWDEAGTTLLASATETTAANIPSGVPDDFCYVQSIQNGATGGVNASFGVANWEVVAYK